MKELNASIVDLYIFNRMYNINNFLLYNIYLLLLFSNKDKFFKLYFISFDTKTHLNKYHHFSFIFIITYFYLFL